MDFNWPAIKAATHALAETSENDHPGSEAAYIALLKFQRENGHEYQHRPASHERSEFSVPSEVHGNG
jgi:hypothetical protein